MPRNEEPLCKVGAVFARIALWILSFTGFVLSALAASSCRFIEVATVTAGGNVSVRYVGLFNFQSGFTCVPQSLRSKALPQAGGASSALQAARAFGVLAPLIGGITMVWVLVTILLSGTNRPLWITQGSLLVAATAFQLISFVAFHDPICDDEPLAETYVECIISDGSAFAISAAIFYLLSSIGVFVLAPPRVPLVGFERGWRGGRVTEGVPGSNRSNNRRGVVEQPQQQTTVVVHREVASNAPDVPPVQAFPKRTGHSVSAEGTEGPGDGSTPSSTHPTSTHSNDNVGVEL